MRLGQRLKATAGQEELDQSILQELLPESDAAPPEVATGPVWASKEGDPRVTRVVCSSGGRASTSSRNS